MKSMKTLMRVRQRDLDLLKRQQAILEQKREEIYKTIDMLADRLRDEMKAAQKMPDMAHFFGDFSAHIKKRQDQLYAHARQTEQELERFALAIREVFSEMKKYELAYEQWKKRERDKVARRESQILDEVAIAGFLRKDDYANS